MNIQQVDYFPYKLPLRSTFQTALGAVVDRQGFVVKIATSEGIIGMGEAAPLTGFGMESLAETRSALSEMSKLLAGRSIEQIDDVVAMLLPFAKTPAAKHGVELALLDLLAQSNQQSLAVYLNPLARDRVEVNAVIGAVNMAISIEQTQKILQQGYKCIKVKVGARSFEQDLQVLTAIRSVASDRIRVRIDANQAWSVDRAIDNLRQLEQLNIEYVEQPIAAWNLEGMAKVRASTNITIAADESVTNLEQLDRVIANRSADVIILKPMAMGGILTARRAAYIAFAAGLDVVITTTIDGSIARLGALHLAASLPEITRACGLATGDLLVKDLPYITPQPEQGFLKLPILTGLGLCPL